MMHILKNMIIGSQVSPVLAKVNSNGAKIQKVKIFILEKN